MRTVVAKSRPDIALLRRPCTGRHQLNFRIFLQNQIFQLAGHHARLININPLLQLHGCSYLCIVRGRKEFGSHQGHQKQTADKDHHRHHHDKHTAMNRKGQGALVKIIQSTQKPLNTIKNPFNGTLFPRGVLPQHLRGQHGRKRKCGNGGCCNDQGYNPAQGPKHNATQSRNQCQREEHSHHGQRGGYHSQPHLIGSINGRFTRRCTLFNMCGDVLQNNNGIVHHHANRDGKRRQGNDVYGISGGIQINKGYDKRNGNGQDNDKGSPPSSQEKEYHQNNKNTCVQDGTGETAYRTFNKFRSIKDGVQLYVGRQVFHQIGQHGLHGFGYLYRIGSTLLLNNDAGSGATVGTLIKSHFGDGVLYHGNIRKLYDPSHKVAHYELVQLLCGFVLTLYPQRIGVTANIQHPTRKIHVLPTNQGAQLFHRKIKGLYLLWIYIHLNFTYRTSGNGYGTNPFDTVQGINQHLIQNLGQGRITLLCRCRHHENGNHIGAELKNNGLFHPIRQPRLYPPQHIAYVVGGFVKIRAPFKLQGQQGKIVARNRAEFFQIVDGIELILEYSGDIGFYIQRPGPLVISINGDHGRIDLGIQIDGQIAHRKKSEDDEPDKDQHRSNRLFYCRFIYSHWNRYFKFSLRSLQNRALATDFHFRTIQQAGLSCYNNFLTGLQTRENFKLRTHQTSRLNHFTYRLSIFYHKYKTLVNTGLPYQSQIRDHHSLLLTKT